MSAFATTVRRIDDTGVPLLLARLFVGGLFAYLAIMKLRGDPFTFLKLIHEYGIFGEGQYLWLNTTAAVLPWIELACAAALILGVCTRGAALLIFGMLLFFAPALLLRAWGMYAADEATYASFCDVKFDCGCGTGEVYICWKMLENTTAQLASLIPLFSRSRLLCLSNLFRGRKASPTPPPQASDT